MLTRRDLMGAAAALALPASRVDARLLDPALPKPLGAFTGAALADLAGAPTTLGAHLPAGRPALLSFWATWCAPCLAEARHLARFQEQTGADRLAKVGLSVDRARDPAKVTAWLAKAGVRYTQLLADPAFYAAVTGRETIVLPRLYLFGPDGAPLLALGAFSGAMLRRLDCALAALPPAG